MNRIFPAVFLSLLLCFPPILSLAAAAGPEGAGKAVSASPVISSSVSAIRFGKGAAGRDVVTRTVTIRNNGTEELEIGGMILTGINVAEFESESDCGTLAYGATCTATVAFAPQIPFGAKSAVLEISSNDPKRPAHKIKLSGKAARPIISAGPKPLKFGKAAAFTDPIPRTLTVRNTGISDLVVSGIAITGINAADFSQTSDCGTIAREGTCTVTVSLDPRAPAGKKTAKLEISSNDPKKPVLRVKMSGVVTSALYSITGVVSYNGSGLGGVTVSTSGKSVTTAEDGSYTITGLKVGSYTLDISRTGFSFDPPAPIIDITSTNAVQDFAGGDILLPQTGQSLCYDSDGSEIVCDGTGQDGAVRAGVAWDAATRFTDHGNGTVTDNLTGLVWLKDSTCVGSMKWVDALREVKEISSGRCGLTDSSEKGDWRLPNRKELMSLVDWSRYYPALPEEHPFIINLWTSFWSSTSRAGSEYRAWILFTESGRMSYMFKGNFCYVWPVRGGR